MNKFRYINYKKAIWLLKLALFEIKYETIDNKIQKQFLVYKERESKRYVANTIIYVYDNNDNDYIVSSYKTLKYFNSRIEAIKYYFEFLNDVKDKTAKYKNIISYYVSERN